MSGVIHFSHWAKFWTFCFLCVPVLFLCPNTLKCRGTPVWLTTWTSSLLFLWCWFSDHLGLHSCNINFIKPGMPPCIPHPYQGEGWIDDGKRRVGVDGKEVGGLVMMTQAGLTQLSLKGLNEGWEAKELEWVRPGMGETERRDGLLKKSVVKQLGEHNLATQSWTKEIRRIK